MVMLFYAISLILAACTYAYLRSRQAVARNVQYQYAMAYCAVKRHPH
jgi:hypothetical protein